MPVDLKANQAKRIGLDNQVFSDQWWDKLFLSTKFGTYFCLKVFLPANLKKKAQKYTEAIPDTL